jgi:PAS domain S-box-containing protein
MNAHTGSGEPSLPEEISLGEIPLHSTNLLTVLDREGVIRYESPSIEQIYGYEQDELVGDPVAEYIHPDDAETVMAAFREIVDSDSYTVEAVEYRHEQPDGTYLWVESIGSANPTEAGYYVINTRDISERKERDARLERTNERLETFASVVSHDLRNPLNVAQARVELASEECESDHLAAAAGAHGRMEALIDELLSLSRSGKRLAGTSRLELADLVADCWRTVPGDDATISIEVDRTLRADPGRLRQLVENLLRNAVEHGSTGRRSLTRRNATEHGGPGVSVTVGETDSGFYIEDDGPGIPAGDRERVFEPGHTGSENGTGLGLSIVRNVVDAHGWDIEITDGAEGGTRFEVSGVEFEE